MATEEDATAPMKKPRSEAQIASLNGAKARELRASRNVIREKHGISDETDETPIDETETETESESASETDEQPEAAAVVEKKPKVQKEKLIKPKKTPSPKPRQATHYQPQQKNVERDEHVPVPQNFRMMSRNNYILFDE